MKSIQQQKRSASRTPLGRGAASLLVLLLAAPPAPARQPKPSHTLTAGSAPYCLVFSPDGRSLASVGEGAKRGGPGELKLWDVATGKNTVWFDGHAGIIMSVAFSPDGKTLASAGVHSDDPAAALNAAVGELRLWDVATGKTTATLATGRGVVTSVAFSSDGKTLASASQAGSVDVWDVATRKKTLSLQTASPPFPDLHSLAFSRDGKTLATGGGHFRRPDGGLTGQVELWDLATGKRTATLHGHPGQGCFSDMFALALSVAFSPDGRMLASGGATTVEVWDVATGKNLMVAQGGGVHVVWRVAFGPDGKTVASVNEVTRPGGGVKRPTQREVRVLEVPTGRQLASFKGDAFSPDGKTVAEVGEDGAIHLWNLAGFRAEKAAPRTPAADRADGPPPAPTGPDKAQEDELAKLRGRWRFVMPEALARQPATHEGRRLSEWMVQWLAVVIDGRTLTVTEIDGGDTPLLRGRLQSVPNATPPALDVTIDHYLPEVRYPHLVPPAARAIGRTVRLHYTLEKDQLRCRGTEPGKEPTKDAPEILLRREAPRGAGTGRPSERFEVVAELQVEGPVGCLTLAPDGKTLATGSLAPSLSPERLGEGAVTLWNLATGKPKATYRHSAWYMRGPPGAQSGGDSQNPILALAFSPDGNLLAAGDKVGAKVWDPATGKDLSGLRYDPGRHANTDAVAFSPDGKILAFTLGSDVGVWDVARRKERLVLTGEGGTVYGLAFSRDGKWLAVASSGNHVTIWSTAGWERRASVNAEVGVLYAASFSADGNRLAVAGEGGVKLWKIVQRGDDLLFQEERSLYRNYARCVTFLPGGRLLAYGTRDSVVLWDLELERRHDRLFRAGEVVESVAAAPDGKTLAVGGWRENRAGGFVRLYHLTDGAKPNGSRGR